MLCFRIIVEDIINYLVKHEYTTSKLQFYSKTTLQVGL